MRTNSELRHATYPISRVLREGYGPGAWHGPDLKAALQDVTAEIAYWRPATDRHNIAEIAAHHAYYVWSVRSDVSTAPPQPFALPGEQWFEIADDSTLDWPRIVALVEEEHRALSEFIDAVDAGTKTSRLKDAELFDLVLGITCHAVYHAGQIQLLKRLHTGAGTH